MLSEKAAEKAKNDEKVRWEVHFSTMKKKRKTSSWKRKKKENFQISKMAETVAFFFSGKFFSLSDSDCTQNFGPYIFL